MPITAGSLRITRRRNMGDYNHREASVELHYVVEGDEKVGDLGDIARVEALTQVAMANATDVRVEPPALIELDPELQEKVEPKKRSRRTKAEMEAPGDPASVSVPPTVTEAAPQATSTVSTAPLTEISDRVLNNACNETMNRIKNKPAIQAIMQQYTDGTVSTIPQAQRTEFLNQLKAL